MKYRIYVKRPTCTYSFLLLPYGNLQRMELPGCFILDIWKKHNHHYELHGFFYEQKSLVGPNVYGSKKDLFGAIQYLLQEKL